jgi:hypothetical protein
MDGSLRAHGEAKGKQSRNNTSIAWVLRSSQRRGRGVCGGMVTPRNKFD